MSYNFCLRDHLMWTLFPVLWLWEWHSPARWDAHSVVRAWGCFPRVGPPTRHPCAIETPILVWLSASLSFHENSVWLQWQRRWKVLVEPRVYKGESQPSGVVGGLRLVPRAGHTPSHFPSGPCCPSFSLLLWEAQLQPPFTILRFLWLLVSGDFHLCLSLVVII